MALTRHQKEMEKAVRSILTRRRATAGDVLELFVNSRMIMEEQGSSREYPTLHLYCDWLLHLEINHKGHLGVLEKLSHTLHSIVEREKANNKNDTAMFLREISDCLELARLRAELIFLHRPIKHCLQLFHSEGNWVLIMRAIISKLLSKPIKIPVDKKSPNGPLSGLAKELSDRYGRWVVISAEFSADEEHLIQFEPERPLLFCIKVLAPNDAGELSLSSFTQLIGPFEFHEDRNDFLFD